MATTKKKVLYIVLAVVLVIVLFIVISLWRLGLFASPELALEERGPLHYCYIDKTGPFSEIPTAWAEIDKLAEQQGIEYLQRCGMYLDNPSQVAEEEMRWRAGFLVADSIAVEEPLQLMVLPQAEYIVARIEANPMVAAFKTYPALEKWITENYYTVVGAAIEIYNEGYVESMFPVIPAQ